LARRLLTDRVDSSGALMSGELTGVVGWRSQFLVSPSRAAA
jgi:hypothetical protein